MLGPPVRVGPALFWPDSISAMPSALRWAETARERSGTILRSRASALLDSLLSTSQFSRTTTGQTNDKFRNRVQLIIASIVSGPLLDGADDVR